MTRHWTAPAALGVLAAILTVWCARAVEVLLTTGPGLPVLTVPSLWLLYAAGPAVLCAVPLVVLARAVLPHAGRSPAVHAAYGLVAGAVVGVVQAGVLLSAWPWQLTAGAAWDLVGLPAVGGLVGGLAAYLVGERRAASDRTSAAGA